MSSNNVIEVRDLEHYYGKNKVLHGLSFDVKEGSIFGLLGKNGAGKTTTINIMMGFLRPDKGQCSILGEPAHALSKVAKRKIGLLHEGHLSYEFFSIEETEDFYSGFYPNWDRNIFSEMMSKLKLKKSHKVKNMSCGQRSQVALAVLMAQGADMLILDDFSMGLDAGYRRLFLDKLTHYSKQLKKTVLITSHIVQDLERFVDDALIIDKGRVLKSTSVSSLKDGLHKYYFETENLAENFEESDFIMDFSILSNGYEVVTSKDFASAKNEIETLSGSVKNFSESELSLEDSFIALTGRY